MCQQIVDAGGFIWRGNAISSLTTYKHLRFIPRWRGNVLQEWKVVRVVYPRWRGNTQSDPVVSGTVCSHGAGTHYSQRLGV